MNSVKTITLAVGVLGFLFGRASAAPWPGQGTEQNPYKIASAADLLALGADPNYYGDHFVLMDDIELSAYTFPAAVIPPEIIRGENFTGSPFAGVFDGNDHGISGLTIAPDENSFLGLFAMIAAGGIVRDLAIIDCNYANDRGEYAAGALAGQNAGTVLNCSATGTVTTQYQAAGGLVGRNDGTVSNSSADASVSSADYVGGLVGYNTGSISDCRSNCSVYAESFKAGGLVGYNYSGSISNSHSSGSVIAGPYCLGAGGLAACNIRGAIVNCRSSCSVWGTSRLEDGTGGLVGYNEGQVSGCCATGSVTGGTNVGGLVGHHYESSYYSSDISDSYAAGAVEGLNYVGGLIGRIEDSNVCKCYSAGTVTSGGVYVGGLAGGNVGTVTITDSYFLNPPGPDNSMGTPLTDAEMKQAASFNWAFGPAETWSICEGMNYPRLVWQIPAGDLGCPDGVAMEDYSALAASWLTEDENNNLAGAAIIDAEDLAVLAENWLAGR